jgi:hypothetical protein
MVVLKEDLPMVKDTIRGSGGQKWDQLFSLVYPTENINSLSPIQSMKAKQSVWHIANVAMRLRSLTFEITVVQKIYK